MHFVKLKIGGFKSFVDPIEIPIKPGMTGIVGPNGCGKSNILDAMRWVMGETAPRRVRGGEMDDMIFKGAAGRPSRNIAEVSVLLDNSDRTAPAQFNGEDEIEVARRIEKNAGSRYTINGNEVLARDVRLLFADMTTGPHSTAMVTQGGIGDIVSAAPHERRPLLEDTAGITGLHARRHEAELRLRTAETNLLRLDDIIQAQEEQLKGLKRQARQAARYTRLAGHIRKAEAALFHLRWREALGAEEQAESDFKAANRRVVDHAATAATTARHQAEAAGAIPTLRQAEVETAAALQRLRIERERMDAESERIGEALETAVRNIAQIDTDIGREKAFSAESQDSLHRLDEEKRRLAETRGKHRAEREAARNALTEIVDILSANLIDMARLNEEVASLEARHIALTQRLQELDARRDSLSIQRIDLEAQRLDLQARARGCEETEGSQEVKDGNFASESSASESSASESSASESSASESSTSENPINENPVAKAERALAEALEQLTPAEEERSTAETTEIAAINTQREAESELNLLQAEVTALAALLEPEETDSFPPLIDALEADPGYETALDAALGDDLSAPVDAPAPASWITLSPIIDTPPLPKSVMAMAEVVKGPPAATRRLSLIGIIEDSADGVALQKGLAPGQRLVNRAGDLWRWDGFRARAGTQAEVTRLANRRRLGEIRGEIPALRNAVTEMQKRCSDAQTRRQNATENERRLRNAVAAAYETLSAAQERQTARQAEIEKLRARIAGNALEEKRLVTEVATTEDQHSEAKRELATLENPTAKRDQMERKQEEIAENRRIEAERRSKYERLAAKDEQQEARLGTINAEIESWSRRAESASSQIIDLGKRRETEEKARREMETMPVRLKADRVQIADRIQAAEKLRQREADALSTGEQRLAEADKAQREASKILSEARQEEVRREERLAQARQRREDLLRQIADVLDIAPENLEDEAELGGESPDREALEARHERLKRERERMGPVNLRAQTEAGEIGGELDRLQSERDELIEAIAKLREGIASLNRESRRRLLDALAKLNEHFGTIFSHLFAGGEAHVSLTDNEAPLEAGLEITAVPPGKKSQALSLMSGGEQTMTALALLFAAFLTNPAPICALDEVDAALDDTNTERFCTLLEKTSREKGIRFLMITHNRATMARVDRLLGVTMGEPGVSQLVSVDLQTAERHAA